MHCIGSIRVWSFQVYNRVCEVITINNVIGVGVEYGPITDLYLHSVPGHQSQQFT